MKKILAVILAMALVFAVMSMNVLAGTELVVRNNGQTGVNKGVDSFDDGTSDHPITINFNENKGVDGDADDVFVDKYAIDIDYYELLIDLTDIAIEGNTEGNIQYYFVWNVDTYKYELCTKNNDGTYTPATRQEGENTVALTGGKQALTIDAFQVTNHSSLPIYYQAKLALEAYVEDSADMTIVLDSTADNTTDIIPVERAKAKVDGQSGGGPATTTLHKITSTPKTDWVTTINKLAAQYVSNATIGTLTVTFSADNTIAP